MNNELITVSSRLMQNYHVGHPVAAGTQIATFKNRAGQVEVLSIGEDFNLYNVYPDTSSDTAWSIMKVELPEGVQATEVAAGYFGEAKGPGAIVQTEKNNQDPNYLPIPVVALFREGGPGTPFTVMKIAKGESIIDNYPPPPAGTLTLRSHQLISDHTMLAYTFTSPIAPTNRLSYQVTLKVEQGKVTGARASYYSIFFVAKDWTVMDYRYAQGKYPPILPVSVYTSDQAKAVEFLPLVTNDGGIFSKVGESECLKVSPTGLENIVFAVRADDKSIVYMRSEDKNIGVNLKVSGNTQVKEIAGTTNFIGRPQVFAIGEDGYLYQAENTGKDEKKWSGFNLIQNLFTFTTLSVTKSGDGVPIVFATSTEDKLYRIYQDPKTTKWFTTEIQYEEKIKEERKIREFNSFSTEVTVFDKKGLLRPGAKVKIWSSSNQNLIINGKGHIMRTNVPVEVKANGAGIVTLISKTYDISTSLLHVSTEYMDDDKGVGIQANGYLSDEFATVTDVDLLEAQGANGPLLKGKFRDPSAVKSMAEALNSSMDSITATAKVYGKKNHGNYSRVVSGAHCHHANAEAFGQPQLIRFGAMAPPSWELSFNEDGLPVYTRHTSKSARALITQSNELHPDIELFLGGSVDWGGLWQMIKNGVCKLVSIVVDPIIDAISTAVHVLIDGVKYVWNGIVTLVEQVFQSVAAFFHRVEVFFDDLLHWLGTIFNWESILRTKDAAVHTINEMLKFMEESTLLIKKRYIDDNINTFGEQLQKIIEDYQETLLPGETIGEIGSKGTANPDTQIENKVESNLIANGYINNHKNADHNFMPVISGLENVIASANALSESFSSSDSFENAKHYFDQIKDKPDQFLQLAMTSLLELMKGIALWALKKIQGFLDDIFDAIASIIHSIREFINNPFYIPLVSEIYEFVTGEQNLPFRYIDLIAIMVAAPGTIVYTIAKKEPPFTDTQALNSFKAYFTAEMLQQKSGLIPPGKKFTRELAEPPSNVASVFNCLSGINYLLLMLFKPVVDTAAIMEEATELGELDPIALRGLSIAECTLNILGLVFSFPWAVEPETGDPQCPEPSDPKSAEFQAQIWTLELAGDGLMDFFFVLVKPEGKVESIFTSIWGAIQLGLYCKLTVDDPERGPNIAKTIPNLLAIGRPITARISGHGADVPVLVAGIAIMGIVDFASNLTMSIYSFKQM